MKIRINPVYGKEIKLKVRSVKFAIIIFLFNLMLGIIAITGFEVMFNMHLNPYVDYSGAAKVFYILISMEIIAVMFLVPAFTAGSIAGEREKQTLDILLTTVLTPEKIVMGKLLSSVMLDRLAGNRFLFVCQHGAVVGGIKPACYIYCIYDRRSWDGGSCTVYACNTRHIILYRKYGNACIHCLEENRSGNGLLNG